MDLQNRENFLNKLAAKMGKPRANVPETMATPVNTYQQNAWPISPKQNFAKNL